MRHRKPSLILWILLELVFPAYAYALMPWWAKILTICWQAASGMYLLLQYIEDRLPDPEPDPRRDPRQMKA